MTAVQQFVEITLTHCGLVMPHGDIALVNIGLGNDLLPDPVLTFHMWGAVAFHSSEDNFTRDTSNISC